MFRRTAIALSLVALLAGTGAAYAQGTQGTTPPAAREHGMGRMQQRLGLTNDQMTAIRTAFSRHRDEQKQAWKALSTAQGELRQLALNGGDANAIAAKTTEVQQLLGQTVALRVKVLQEIGPVLTPDQRAKFAQAHFQPGMGRHHRKPAPTQS
jgi:Spy/CpxP family protein refolding chaperone